MRSEPGGEPFRKHDRVVFPCHQRLQLRDVHPALGFLAIGVLLLQVGLGCRRLRRASSGIAQPAAAAFITCHTANARTRSSCVASWGRGEEELRLALARLGREALALGLDQLRAEDHPVGDLRELPVSGHQAPRRVREDLDHPLGEGCEGERDRHRVALGVVRFEVPVLPEGPLGGLNGKTRTAVILGHGPRETWQRDSG